MLKFSSAAADLFRSRSEEDIAKEAEFLKDPSMVFEEDPKEFITQVRKLSKRQPQMLTINMLTGLVSILCREDTPPEQRLELSDDLIRAIKKNKKLMDSKRFIERNNLQESRKFTGDALFLSTAKANVMFRRKEGANSKIVKKLDKVLLLASSDALYFGAAEEAFDYLAESPNENALEKEELALTFLSQKSRPFYNHATIRGVVSLACALDSEPLRKELLGYFHSLTDDSRSERLEKSCMITSVDRAACSYYGALSEGQINDGAMKGASSFIRDCHCAANQCLTIQFMRVVTGERGEAFRDYAKHNAYQGLSAVWELSGDSFAFDELGKVQDFALDEAETPAVRMGAIDALKGRAASDTFGCRKESMDVISFVAKTSKDNELLFGHAVNALSYIASKDTKHSSCAGHELNELMKDKNLVIRSPALRKLRGEASFGLN